MQTYQKTIGTKRSEFWKGIHIVGDSAMILGLMRQRKSPNERKMQHWYRLTR
ncbi:hypothetical protein JG687_00017928, partial [Phytophthora cactorum]